MNHGNLIEPVRKCAGALSRFPRWHGFVLVLVSVALSEGSASAQRLMERLGRGMIAVRTNSTSVYVGWRLLGDEPSNLGFRLYRAAGGTTNLLTPNPVTNSCNFVDTGANLTIANSYFVRAVSNEIELPAGAPFTLPANSTIRQYLVIPLTPPPAGTSPATADGEDAGGPYTYNANDCSAGDLDGDGEYEIVLKWDPTNSKDNSQSGFTGNTYLDAYRLDGAFLWRIDLGPNIRSGAHYTQFIVHDLDGDGRAEVMCRTAPGSKDGLGSYVAGAAKWQNSNGARPSFNDTDDYRTIGPNGVNGYVLAGPEFMTVFDGLTGAELASATYYPKRDQDNNSDNPTASRMNTVWGDNYGNRIDRFLAGLAFVDGKMPSAIFCRGYYTRAFITAWDWRDGRLTRRWTFDSNSGNAANLLYRGQGAHSLTIGDVDADGKDEIVYGAATIDDNGQGLYSTQLGHGDALHLSDMDPARPGLEIWMIHEDPGSYGPYGSDFRDARTGQVIFGVDGQNSDVGRGVAIDIDPRYRGYELWASRGGLMSAAGFQISSTKPSQVNFAIWWDADLTREILDGTTISKWNWNSSSSSSVLTTSGLTSNNGTKSTPGLSADLFGDWREEVVWRTSDNLQLRVFTTTVVATNRFYTLMHDPQYRCAIAWQNTGYNQPPHPGFNIGPQMLPPPPAPLSNARLVWRGGLNGNNWDFATANWRTNGVWSTNNPPVAFTSGSSVLFDVSGSNQPAIQFAAAIAAGEVTVSSPRDYVFSGSGSLTGASALRKAGQGRLTISTTNDFTGTTIVSGGRLIVNGTLEASPVLVESRGNPEGAPVLAGIGRLGNGLVMEAGSILIVGPDTNAPGTLSISNQLTLRNVLGRFDLSNDVTGTAKTNDSIAVEGSLVVSGTNILEITQPDSYLASGIYPLILYTGSFSGSVTSFVLSGTFVQPVQLTNPPGQIALLATIPTAPPAAPSQLVATALSQVEVHLAWKDNSTNENATVVQRSVGNALNFVPVGIAAANDTNFSDIGLSPNTTYYYRVQSTNLAGFSAYSNTNSATTPLTPPALVWRGDGTQNVWNVSGVANWMNGATPVVFGNGSFVTFDNSGSNTPNINVVEPVLPGSMLINASRNYTFNGGGSIGGAMTLVKAGAGTVSLGMTNTFTGGMIVSNGTVALIGTGAGSYTANTFVPGSGAVTLRGGRLAVYGYNLSDNTSSFGTFTNRIIVDNGQSGTVLAGPRQTLASRITGGGTLTLSVDYLRGDVGGDWTGFTGALNVVPTTGTPNSGTVDDFRVTTASGFPSVRLNVASNVLMYSRAAAGSAIPIGEFSGAQGAVVSAGFGSSAGVQNAVTWAAGGLNTHATNAALFQGTVSLLKQGSGTWTLLADNTYTGTTLVNAGKLLVNGNQSAASGALTVGTNGALGGIGIIGGATTIQGQLSPGISIGTLTFNSGLTLAPGSSSVFEIRRAPLTNDMVQIFGAASLDGELVVLNISPELLEAGDRFRLFDAPVLSGEFASYDLPLLEEGLGWNTSRLNVDGNLWVVRTTPPQITAATLSPFGVVLSGSGGTPDWSYYVLSTTNIAVPAAQWDRIATNQFDASGGFSFTNAAGNDPQRYFRIQLP